MKKEKAEDVPYVPIEKWAKDHWSTFAYLEMCAVDNNGIIDNRRMRCNPRIHRELANIQRPNSSFASLMDGTSYATRLKNGEEISGEKHDDWSCVEDMIAFKLIKMTTKVTDRISLIGNSRGKVKFTELGFKIAGQLRAYKANGGQFKDFIPEL